MAKMDAGMRAMQRKQRRQWAVLTMLLAAALVIGVVRLVHQGPEEVTASTTDETVDASSAGSVSEPVVPVEINWPVEVRRDLFAWESVFPEDEPTPEPEPVKAPPEPTAPMPDVASVTRAATQNVRLHAIIHGDDPIAMINNEVWREGQQVNGFRIVRIASRHIVISKDGIQITLEL
ncbi:MAG: hypothetical protein WD294_16750 [Phycisphaeraceae bacterium]